MVSSALVVGASGIVGSNLARHLRKRGWQVHGLARRPPTEIEGMLPIAADLLDLAALRLALQAIIANSARSSKSFLDVTRFEQTLLPCLAGPNASEEVGLKLEPNGKIVRFTSAHSGLG